jgi:hypothetical protein
MEILLIYIVVGLLDGAMHVWAVLYSHKNKDSLYGRRSLESGIIEQIVYKYRASPTVRSIDFIIQMHHSQRSTPQVDNSKIQERTLVLL